MNVNLRRSLLLVLGIIAVVAISIANDHAPMWLTITELVALFGLAAWFDARSQKAKKNVV